MTGLLLGLLVAGFALVLSLAVVFVRWKVRDRRRRLARLRERRIGDELEERRLRRQLLAEVSG